MMTSVLLRWLPSLEPLLDQIHYQRGRRSDVFPVEARRVLGRAHHAADGSEIETHGRVSVFVRKDDKETKRDGTYA